MHIGDNIIAVRKINLANGKNYFIGTKGAIIDTPPSKTVIHVMFEKSDSPCVISVKNVREEDTRPKIGEKIRQSLSSKFNINF